MTAVFSGIFYLLILLVVGWLVGLLIRRFDAHRPNWREQLIDSIGLGLAVLPMLSFWLMIGLSLPLRFVLILLAMIAVITFIAQKMFFRKVNPAEVAMSANQFDLPLFLIVAAVCFFASLRAMFLDIYEWDAIGIWALHAKMLVTEPLSISHWLLQDPALSYSHQSYPLLVPLHMAMPCSLAGEFDGRLAKLSQVLFAVVLIASAGRMLPQRLNKHIRWLLLAVVASAPEFLKWAGTATADVALATFIALTVAQLLRWQRYRKPAALISIAIYSAAAAFTKQEGLAFCIAVVIAIAFFANRKWQFSFKVAGQFLLLTGLLHAAWFVWSRKLPETHENYMAHLSLSTLWNNADRIAPIAMGFATSIVDFLNQGIIWLLTVIAIIANITRVRRQPVRACVVLIVLMLAAYSIVLMITPWDLATQMAVVKHRMLLHLIAPGAVILGYLAHWMTLRPNAA